MKTKPLNIGGTFIGVTLFGVALWVLHHELKAHQLRDILLRLNELPRGHLFLALLLTTLGYPIMIGSFRIAHIQQDSLISVRVKTWKSLYAKSGRNDLHPEIDESNLQTAGPNSR